MNDTERKKEERSNLKRNNHCHWQYRFNDYDAKCAWERGGKVKRTTPEIPQTVVTVHSKTNYRAWKDKGSKKMIATHVAVGEKQKNNTRDSNVVPHRSTNLARQCLTSLSRREAVLSLWCGRSWILSYFLKIIKLTYIFITAATPKHQKRNTMKVGRKSTSSSCWDPK